MVVIVLRMTTIARTESSNNSRCCRCSVTEPELSVGVAGLVGSSACVGLAGDCEGGVVGALSSRVLSVWPHLMIW